jgi:hypothetical protein
MTAKVAVDLRAMESSRARRSRATISSTYKDVGLLIDYRNITQMLHTRMRESRRQARNESQFNAGI